MPERVPYWKTARKAPIPIDCRCDRRVAARCQTVQRRFVCRRLAGSCAIAAEIAQNYQASDAPTHRSRGRRYAHCGAIIGREKPCEMIVHVGNLRGGQDCSAAMQG